MQPAVVIRCDGLRRLVQQIANGNMGASHSAHVALPGRVGTSPACVAVRTVVETVTFTAVPVDKTCADAGLTLHEL